MYIDLKDPEQRAKAIEHGYVWDGPVQAQEAAIEDIASGRVPAPAWMPDWAKRMIEGVTGKAVSDPNVLGVDHGPDFGSDL